ncbi:molybdopterin-guanine dinucleotide biosynthesis protein B [Aquibaculum arenosum]|uniref:Molybdopterin-guanine dinucleotide biosynthesis protein B n=1 Tax=Aquibaculum arenosum TaxID=3032591 RepID=A0ABT5YM43_9PROT|nr:molybdopterin-guanine dinucleotide biosynthesis protein B [Fodinicurvata sp. CAU 1616]MDF2095922.1 molybdopterin-guanine dinucleotide biosynthesis protein B [Fodinicurvata sp. CAU 1616]
MKVIGLAGWSGAGKTTLVCKLIPALRQRGISVSTIKHAHHAFDVDKPGKDSYEHRAAGATEVLVSSGKRWALMHELREEAEPTVDELLAHLSPVDLAIIEGFKREAHDKIEVWRRSVDKPLLAGEDPQVVAICSDGPVPEAAALPGGTRPVLDLNDVEAIADFILAHCGLAAKLTQREEA